MCVRPKFHLAPLFLIALGNIQLFSLARAIIFHESEGGYVLLRFQFTETEKCTFKLFYNNFLFNDNGAGQITNNYDTEKHQRTLVQTFKTLTLFTLSVKINDLRISDTGEYLCYFACQDISFTKQYKLLIHYPPKQASCYWTDDQGEKSSNSADLSSLHCKAKRGLPPGKIVCYSRYDYGTKLFQPVDIESKSDEILARFWLRKDSNIRCCSENYRFPKKYDFCKDFLSYFKERRPVGKEISKDRRSEGITPRILTPSQRYTIHVQDTPVSFDNAHSMQASFIKTFCLATIINNMF